MSAAGRRRRKVSNACMNGKGGNGFKVSARALVDASAAVEEHVVQIVRQDRGGAAASIPVAVMSVVLQSVH